MEQYLINDTSLVGIADALRRQHGETYSVFTEEVVPSPPVISKTPNALSFTERNGGYGNYTSFFDVVKIPGAHSIKVKMAYETENTSYDYVQIASGDVSKIGMSTTATKYGNKTIKQIELEFPDTDIITFYFYSDSSNHEFLGYYAECTGYDADGNPATITNIIETKYPNEYKPSEMAAAIDNIKVPTVEALTVEGNGIYVPGEGVGGFNPVIVNLPPQLPPQATNITGKCAYKFAYDGWSWLINEYSDQIKTENIESADYMFYKNSTVENIPFDINMKIGTGFHTMNNMFQDTSKLKAAPRIINAKPYRLERLFSACQNLRSIPEDFCDTWDWSYATATSGTTNGSCTYMFYCCYSLRNIPSNLINKANPILGDYYSITYNGFTSCYTLDEIIGLFANTLQYGRTVNHFTSTFANCYRLKNMIFDMNEDGTPYVVKWRNQTVDLSSNVGYVNSTSTSSILNFNSGITADKQVKDDASYQTLKDDPDWFTLNIAYSRFNHDSAVNTINSLPDTSAYITEVGGANAIKFKGAAGSATDGGAINTLTEEEIAVAAAKGWTVSIV